jgi:hypothetical protein
MRCSPTQRSCGTFPVACDLGRSLARLGSLIGHQQRHGFGKWAVIEKAAGA